MRRFEADLLGRPRLNFDVLRLVCNSLTEISDVLSFALTCSALAAFAFQRRLRMSPINLSDGKVVDSFHRFIFADEAARAPYIYGLKLPNRYKLHRGRFTSPGMLIMQDRLVSILEAAIHLEYIYFPTTVDLDPVLIAATNMASLRELHIVFSAFGGHSKWSPWKLLGTLRSPLRSLRIDSAYDSADEGFLVKSIHDHLANFALTLEVLEIHSIDFDDFPSPVTTQFTALRSFTTHTVLNFDESTMEVLLRLFPNLDDTLALGSLGTMRTEHDLPNLREWNKEVQTTRTWSGFDRVVCDVRLAFLMALQCPIRRRHIMVLRFYGRGLLEPILRDNCPRILHLSLQFIDILHDLNDLFPSTKLATLTHLVVFVDVEDREGRLGKPTSIPWAQFRDKLIDSVTQHLCLTHLRVVFHYAVWYPRATQASSTIQEQLQDAVYTVGEADLHTVATRVFDAMPTAQYILLTTCGHTYRERHWSQARPGGLKMVNKWHSSKAWRRAADPFASGHRELSDAKGSPVELNGEAAEKIIAQEELYLSIDEEDQVRECSDVMARRD